MRRRRISKAKQSTARHNNRRVKVMKISITDLDIFTDLVRLMKEMTKDERIEESIREEYRQKVLELTKR